MEFARIANHNRRQFRAEAVSESAGNWTTEREGEAMNTSDTIAKVRLLHAIQEIERLTFNEVLPCAAYLKLEAEGGNGEIWQKITDAGLAAREFLNNHNVTIEPKKGKQ